MYSASANACNYSIGEIRKLNKKIVTIKEREEKEMWIRRKRKGKYDDMPYMEYRKIMQKRCLTIQIICLTLSAIFTIASCILMVRVMMRF